ncbi:MAG: alpha/beta hydrolase [Anaerolineales bacterium]|nr:alpha/beta hydrolase [Anaerolineales bacterium]
MTPATNLPSLAEIHDLDRSTQTITLKDQRKLSFNIFGADGGVPVFYFHGGPSSRLEGSLHHQTAIQRNYQIICLDRPGHGLSDPKPGYEIVNLADDVLELAAHLGLDRFGVMGTSGGGPPVIACAYRLKDHLDFAAAFGSAAPIYTDPTASRELSAFDRITAKLSVSLPRWIFVFLMGLMIGTFKNINTSDRYKKIFGSLLCDADLEIVESEPEFIQAMMLSIIEAFRQGAGGPADDTVAIVKDWGFLLTEIDFPVVLVHGTEDKHVPYSFSEYMQAHIPNSRLVPLEGEGHYTHIINVARSFDIIEGIYTEE